MNSLQPNSTTVPNLQPVLPNNPNTPWLVSPQVFQRMQPSGNTGSHQKCEIKAGDPEWTFIQQYFEAQRPENRSIGRVYCIHNSAATRQFEATISTLETEATNPAFTPKWQQGDCAPLRQKVIDRWKSATAPYSPFSITWPGKRTDTYQHVKILPLWHGTKASICQSICDVGFTFFGKQDLIHGTNSNDPNTDLGYFGSGIYFTNSARYAAQIYSGDDGRLFLAWVSMREPYPVVADSPYDTSGKPKPKDMKKLEGSGAYQNYNAHYIPVSPVNPSYKMCAVYYPCATGQEPILDEIAVFQKSQALARFQIELQIDLPIQISPKPLGEPQATVGILFQKVLDLLEEQAILQDSEVYSALASKAGILINLNPNQELSTSEQEFLRWTSQLLDTNGKVRGFVRNKLAQPQPLTISEPKSLTHSNVIYPIVSSTKPHFSNPYPISTTTSSSNPFTINNSSIIQTSQPNPISTTTNNSNFFIINNSPIIHTSQPKPISISTSPTSLLTIPSCAFGAAQWNKHFGDVGVEPPLPLDIHQILQGPCPILSGKIVQETHLLTLIPATIDGNPFTFQTLGELIKNPKTGPATRFAHIIILGEYQDNPVPQSYWILMSRDVLEGSRRQTYKTQFDQVATLAKKTGIPYAASKVLEAATCILMHHVSTGKKLYTGGTYTRCQDFHTQKSDYKLIVGGFRTGGLLVFGSGWDGDDRTGVSVCRTF